jgi:lysophospholipase L1-like esterase
LLALIAGCGGGGGGSSSSSPPAASKSFFASWTQAAQDLTEGLPGQPHVTPDFAADRTIREVAHLSVGGDALRIKVSNRFGTSPLMLGAVHVARATDSASIDPSSDHAVTFGGSTMVTIAPGADAVSDAVNLPVSPLSDVAVSLYLAQATALATGHKSVTNTSVIAPGNGVAAATLAGPTSGNLYFVTALDVSSADATHVVVAFGDSITDGAQSTPGAHMSYPEQLAVRASGATNPRIAVVDAGIGGNRWLQDDPGPAGKTRFDTDVLQVQGVTHAIVLLGINDFEVARAFGLQPVTADALTAAAGDVIARAKSGNVKVLLATITPYKGSGLFNADDEAQRQAYNAWVRQNKDAAAIVDFDMILRDPNDAQSLAPSLSSADHLHPNDAGYAAMAAAIDLAQLR